MPELMLTILSSLIFGIVACALYFRHRRNDMFHRERMTALEKGLPVPVEFWEPPSLTSRTYLLRGLIWLVVGLALPVLFVAMWLAAGRTDSKFLALATMGIVPLGVGAAYLYVRRVEGQETKG